MHTMATNCDSNICKQENTFLNDEVLDIHDKFIYFGTFKDKLKISGNSGQVSFVTLNPLLTVSQGLRRLQPCR